jgi:hypothetical protein
MIIERYNPITANLPALDEKVDTIYYISMKQR